MSGIQQFYEGQNVFITGKYPWIYSEFRKIFRSFISLYKSEPSDPYLNWFKSFCREISIKNRGFRQFLKFLVSPKLFDIC